MDDDSYYIDYKNGYIYLTLDPMDKRVEITAHDGALTRTTRAINGRAADRVGPTIRGISFTQYAYRALEIEGADPDGPADPSTFGKDVVGTTLEHVTITYCSRVAAYLRGDHLTLRHCLISDTETEGIYILSSSDCLLERNIFRRNNMQNMQGYFPSAVKIFNQTWRVVCRDNYVTENPHSNGIWYDVGNRDGVFINNWVEDSLDGFFFEISRGVTVAGNLFVNCDNGIRILNAADAHIYNNTLVNSRALFERTTRSAVGDHFGWHPATGPDVDERHGHTFINNLLVADKHYWRPIFHVDQVPELCGVLTDDPFLRLDQNVYVWRGMPQANLIHWSPVEGEVCTRQYASVEAFRKEQPEWETNSRNWLNYPGQIFVSQDLNRFELLPDFPGARVAGDLPQDILELLGWTQQRARTPGAFPVAQ